MVTSDKPRFAAAIAAAAEVHNKKLSRPAMSIYFDALSDLSLEQVETAVRVCLRVLKWFPKPSEIREFAGQSLVDRIEKAWLKAVELSRNDWWNTSVRIDDLALNAAIRSFGGLRAICNDDFPQFGRRRFEDAYRASLGSTDNRPFEQGDVKRLKPVTISCDYLSNLNSLPTAASNELSPLIETLKTQLIAK